MKELRVTIIGLGMIGGSLALAFRGSNNNLPVQITGALTHDLSGYVLKAR